MKRYSVYEVIKVLFLGAVVSSLRQSLSQATAMNEMAFLTKAYDSGSIPGSQTNPATGSHGHAKC